MKLILSFILSAALCGATLDHYLELIETHPKSLGNTGDHRDGEIELLLSPQEIQITEQVAKKRLLAKGYSESLATEWSRVGIIAEDQYLYWLRDAVIFPNGERGTYDRILWKSNLDDSPGVAILPYLPDKKIIVNLNYRHATRNWEIELPRGSRKEGETLKQAATRELKEETGYELDDTLLLGVLAVDSGILTTTVPVLACKAIKPMEREQEFSEAIYSNPILSIEELETALLQGFWNVSFSNRVIRAHVRDPFLAYALLQIKLRRWQD